MNDWGPFTNDVTLKLVNFEPPLHKIVSHRLPFPFPPIYPKKSNSKLYSTIQ